jgi:predicted lipoprotein with Yx(FWY)xxD motif
VFVNRNSTSKGIDMPFRTMLIAASAAIAFAVPQFAGAADAPGKKSGDMLVGSNGMTLYVFDKDTAGSGKSACNGSCPKSWPPLAASADAKPTGDWSVITRDDGTRQWAYNGRPVYDWSKYLKAGVAGGAGI